MRVSLTAMASVAASAGADWEVMWSRGLAPGQAFDAAKPELALQALIPGSGVTGLPTASGSLALSGKRALVPGCGRGYAVEALSRGGASSVEGLEISATAARAATDYLGKTLGSSSSSSSSSWMINEGNFFELEVDEEGKSGRQPFDLVYDCTFLCAIPPASRQAWAAKMAQIVRPGGELVVLVFPVRQDVEGGADPGDELLSNPGSGPPYSMTPLLVQRLLLPPGGQFSLASCEKVPDRLITRNFAGEYIARFIRR